MNRLALKFLSHRSKAQLHETEFFSPLIAQTLLCIRGQQSFRENTVGVFPWTSGVLGLCAVMLKAKAVSLRPSDDHAGITDAELSSACTEWACSLDFALSKRPRWILDMLGIDASGTPILKRLFHRKNPERKRPGPVSVALNTSFLEPKNIAIYLDGAQIIHAAAIELLLQQIGFSEQSYLNVSRFQANDSVARHFPSKASESQYSFTHREPLRARPLTFPCIDDAMALPLSITDLVLDIIQHDGTMRLKALTQRLHDFCRPVIPAKFIDNAVLKLSRQGVFEVKGDLISCNPGKALARGAFFSDLCKFADELSIRSSRESGRCIKFEFSSLAQQDNFLAPFYDRCLTQADGATRTWWHLNHSTWPLLRPQAECRRSLEFPAFSNTSYLSLGTGPLDSWVQHFYQKMGVVGHLNSNSPYPFDFWLIGDLYVEHKIPSQLNSGISEFIQSFNSIENFDNVGLERGFYYPTERCEVAVHFAPGLAGIMRQQLLQLSTIGDVPR